MPLIPPLAREVELQRVNREFYEPLWNDAKLIAPERFNTWPLVQSLLAPHQRRLEIAPGLRPRLPLHDTEFLDLSEKAVAVLQRAGARARAGKIGELPFAAQSFDLVCALDIIEHVEDDVGAVAELSRVLTPQGTLLTSIPLHPECWTAFDDFVGHRRRYTPAGLMTLLAREGFEIERSAIYGMQPKSSRLLDLGMWYLTHQRERAMWWYNHVFMPLQVRFQKKLTLTEGFIDTVGVDEVLLVCKRNASRAS
jgi:SAM-dependent methyltransferase